MNLDILAIHTACMALAMLLFFVVNWIGHHAVIFGYSSTTLFEDPNESLALNFIIRTLPPAVLMVLLSALAVASGNDELRLQSYWIAVYYYVFRAAYFPIVGLYLLINWRRFILHAGIGLGAAWAAHHYLILPKKSLLPDLGTAGNELWLAMLFFVYAVANSINIDDHRSASRRNSYVKEGYLRSRRHYGVIVDEMASEDLLRLIVYSVIVYENYCRPPIVRIVERTLFWREGRTTGVMQVASDVPLTDAESVKLGTDKLLKSWLSNKDDDLWQRVRSTISDYNRDDDYIYKVIEVMEVISKRVEPEFHVAYSSMWPNQKTRKPTNSSDRQLRIRRAMFSRINSPRRHAMQFRKRRKA